MDNVLLQNPKLIHGLTKSSALPTRIVSNGNTEYRMRTNAFERFSWEWPASTMKDEHLRDLYRFWNQRGGGLTAFLFQDPDYPNFVNAPLSSAGGSKWFLRVPTFATAEDGVYYDGVAVPNEPGLHRIFNLDLSKTTCTRNGSPATITSAQIEPTTGEPTITVFGSNSSQEITISGPCYFSVRFDSNIEWSMTGLDENNQPLIHTYSPIRLIEVFESTL